MTTHVLGSHQRAVAYCRIGGFGTTQEIIVAPGGSIEDDHLTEPHSEMFVRVPAGQLGSHPRERFNVFCPVAHDPHRPSPSETCTIGDWAIPAINWVTATPLTYVG